MLGYLTKQKPAPKVTEHVAYTALKKALKAMLDTPAIVNAEGDAAVTARQNARIALEQAP